MNLPPYPFGRTNKSSGLFPLGSEPYPHIGLTYVRPSRRLPLTLRRAESDHGAIAVGNHLVPFESPLEQDYLLMRAVDPRVICVTSRPFEVGYVTADGRSGWYTPSFLVERDLTAPTVWPQRERSNKTALVVEVRAALALARLSERERLRFDVARKLAVVNGLDFEIVTEADAPFELARFANRFVSRQLPYSPLPEAELLAFVEEKGFVNLGSVSRRFGMVCQAADAMHSLGSLVTSGRLETDFERHHDWSVPIRFVR